VAQQAELEIALRKITGKASKRLRKAGLIPANISGHKEPSLAVQVDAVLFERLRREHGTRKILSLHLPDAGTQTVLIRQVQHEPRSGKILHVDFDRVSLNERVTIKVPLHFVGESPAVEDKGGVLLHLVEELEVECLASDIVGHIDVDISSLTEIDAVLHAKDVKLPTNFKLVIDPEEPIAKVAATRAEVAAETAQAAATETPTAPTSAAG